MSKNHKIAYDDDECVTLGSQVLKLGVAPVFSFVWNSLLRTHSNNFQVEHSKLWITELGVLRSKSHRLALASSLFPLYIPTTTIRQRHIH